MIIFGIIFVAVAVLITFVSVFATGMSTTGTYEPSEGRWKFWALGFLVLGIAFIAIGILT